MFQLGVNRYCSVLGNRVSVIEALCRITFKKYLQICFCFLGVSLFQSIRVLPLKGAVLTLSHKCNAIKICVDEFTSRSSNAVQWCGRLGAALCISF